MKARALLVSAALSALAGCHLIAGTQDFVDQPLGGGGAGGGGGEAGCRCVDVAPDGWQGPLALDRSVDAESCAAPYPDELTRGGEAVGDASILCSCSCDSVGAACSSGALTVAASDGAACDVACSDVVSLPADACVDVSLARPAGCFTALPAGVSHSDALAGSWTGACEPVDEPPVIDPPVWSQSAIVCQGEVERGACEKGATCAPSPNPLQRICIAHDGEQPCPAGPYSEQTILYQAFIDDRACAPCACTEGSCSGQIETFSQADCALGSLGTTQTGVAGCSELGTLGALGVRYSVDAAQLQCSAQPASATGGVAPAEPLTLCCLVASG